ncbi:MAG: hypothetical protein KatS3mg008_1966 [Acidimicrobiales bacterium]|nr:MAG: hypothetical protein KatS3mg008_1966 [Acidimicrobiales bacterium]
MAEGAIRFADFYRAINRGREPLPWQQRLAETVIRDGWPEEVGVPTGLGKTASIDIALWSLVCDLADEETPRRAPTRIWYVVNRRLLVDAAYEHGRRIAELIENPECVEADWSVEKSGDMSVDRAREVLEAARDALGSVGLARDPLVVVRLRGGAEIGARPPDPAQPSLVFATVPMFASRWLFRGYGTSANMRSVDAALAGIDSLILLDEAHLARPLLSLAGPLSECDVGDPSRVLQGDGSCGRARPTLVSLTATGGGRNVFDLDEEDRGHPIIKKRLGAAKPVRLVRAKKSDLVKKIVETTFDLLGDQPGPSVAIVFVNDPRKARELWGGFAGGGKRRPEVDRVLLTGRIREREAAAIRKRLLDPDTGAPSGRDRESQRKKWQRHLVIVATQTLEVGADLDADVMVTESCGSRALVQRLGRLNRLGESSTARGAIVHAEDEKNFGVYQDEPLEVWQRLVAAAEGSDELELGPDRVRTVLGEPNDAPPRTPELLPAHLWEWAKTTIAPPGEVPVEIFFEGFSESLPQVSVVWRAYIPESGGVLLRPVSAEESVDVPIGEARSVLSELVGETVARVAYDGVSVEHVAVGDLRPGDTVLVGSDRGGYDEHGWAPESRSPVLDVSLLDGPGLPLTSEVFRLLFEQSPELERMLQIVALVGQPPDPEEEFDRVSLQEELFELIRAAQPSALLRKEEWDQLRQRFSGKIVHPAGGVGVVEYRPVKPGRDPIPLRSDALDELSRSQSLVELLAHCDSVGAAAEALGRQIGIADELCEALRAAGEFHDLGKADSRFQRWLDPEEVSPEPLAKSARPWSKWRADRIASGWPEGGRHEELSRRLVEAWLAKKGESGPSWDPDLVLHLVTSHHGYGRPLVPPTEDRGALPVRVKLASGDVLSASGDLSWWDTEQPARFRRCCERYGYWGLALLEAVLRQADHAVSEVTVA